MTRVVIQPDGEWLEAPAAASFSRMLAAGMPASRVREAGRTYERQQYLRTQYVNNVPGFNFALPAGTSIHERGNAIDADEPMRGWLHAYGRTFGWRNTTMSPHYEAWHFEYEWWNDQHRADVAIPEPISPILEPILEDIMSGPARIVSVTDGRSAEYLFDPEDGTFLTFTSGVQRDVSRAAFETEDLQLNAPQVDELAAIAKRKRIQRASGA